MDLEIIDVLFLVSRWIHIAAVVVAIGGAFFMRVALIPAANAALSDEEHNRLRGQIMARWKMVVHVSVAVLLLTGFVNFFIALNDKVQPIPYHPIFGVKLIGALIVFFLAIALTGSNPGFSKLREHRGKWLSILIALAAVLILLSGVLKMAHQASPVAQ